MKKRKREEKKKNGFNLKTKEEKGLSFRFSSVRVCAFLVVCEARSGWVCGGEERRKRERKRSKGCAEAGQAKGSGFGFGFVLVK